MSQLCAVTKCNRAPRWICDCCQQNLCLQHLNEHNALLISQLNPLTDEINALSDRLKSLNIQKPVSSCHRELERWRDDCHQMINRLFQQKSKELNQLIDKKIKKQQEELLRIHSQVAELIREQETTRQDIDSLTSTIHHLKEQMDKIENTCFDINTRPLMIDDSFIDIKELNKLDLSILSPACKTINYPGGNSVVISNNGRFLLTHKNSNLCLVDREMNIVKEVPWTHDNIYDMCWSSTINQFILVEGKCILLVDDETMTISNVQTIEERAWSSCTCSENSFFLSTNVSASSIMKFTLLPKIELIKEWKSPQTCAQHEIIHKIVYNDGVLGVVIKNTTEKSLRLELKSAETLDRIWSLGFDTVCNQNVVFRCCLLTNDEWLVIDYETKRLLHVIKDGKLKTTIPYDGIPYCANIFANMLVVSTSKGVNFHKL
jgi:polyhydroxyalkanoate synthesis regulator phasin